MKNNTNKKVNKQKTISYESAVAFCQMKIKIDANEIGLEINPSHSDVKPSELVLVYKMYNDLYIYRYERHLEAINFLSDEDKPLNYKNMKNHIDDFDKKDFAQYLEFQKQYDEDEERHLEYVINMAENKYFGFHLE